MIKAQPHFAPWSHALDDDFDKVPDGAGGEMLLQRLRPLSEAERTAWKDQRKKDLQTHVNAIAQLRIYAIAPDHKQKNLQRRGLELLLKNGAQPNLWPVEDQKELADGLAIGVQIDAIRTASNRINDDIMACDDGAALSSWDVPGAFDALS